MSNELLELEKQANQAKYAYSILDLKVKIAKKQKEIEELENNINHFKTLLEKEG